MVPVIKGRRTGFRRFWRWLWVGLVMGGGADTRLCRLSARPLVRTPVDLRMRLPVVSRLPPNSVPILLAEGETQMKPYSHVRCVRIWFRGRLRQRLPHTMVRSCTVFALVAGVLALASIACAQSGSPGLSVRADAMMVDAYLIGIESILNAFDDARTFSVGCGLAGLVLGTLLVWGLAARFPTGQKWQAVLVLLLSLGAQQLGLHLAMDNAVRAQEQKLDAQHGLSGAGASVVPLGKRAIFDDKVLAERKGRALRLGQRFAKKLPVFDRFNLVKHRYERGVLWLHQTARAAGIVFGAFLSLIIGLHILGRRGIA